MSSPAMPQETLVTTGATTRWSFGRGFRGWVRRHGKLSAGLTIMGVLVLFSALGPLYVDTGDAQPMSAMPDVRPSWEYPFGTDDQGRNLLAVAVVGLPLTLLVGLIAGYVGGVTDVVIRGISDVLLTVPGLVVLITIAASIEGVISVGLMALVVSSLAWMWPTRTIRLS